MKSKCKYCGEDWKRLMKIEDLRLKMRDAETAIRYILAHYPEARSNDKLLMILYWELVDKIPITKEFRRAFIRRATTPETITRARRKIQASGDYLPREEVLEYRRKREKKMRELFKGQTKLF